MVAQPSALMKIGVRYVPAKSFDLDLDCLSDIENRAPKFQSTCKYAVDSASGYKHTHHASRDSTSSPSSS